MAWFPESPRFTGPVVDESACQTIPRTVSGIAVAAARVRCCRCSLLWPMGLGRSRVRSSGFRLSGLLTSLHLRAPSVHLAPYPAKGCFPNLLSRASRNVPHPHPELVAHRPQGVRRIFATLLPPARRPYVSPAPQCRCLTTALNGPLSLEVSCRPPTRSSSCRLPQSYRQVAGSDPSWESRTRSVSRGVRMRNASRKGE